MTWPFCGTPCISLWLDGKVDEDGEEGRNQDAQRPAQLNKEFVFYSEGCGINKILLFSIEGGLEERKAVGREISEEAIALIQEDIKEVGIWKIVSFRIGKILFFFLFFW